MSLAVTAIEFGEWMPDLPELNHPGLVRAVNVLPKDAGYSAFLPFSSTGGIVSINSISGSFMASGATKGAARIYAYSGDFYVGGAGSVFATRGSVSQGSLGEQFAQYGNLVIATSEGHIPVKHTISSTSAFSTLSAEAPPAEAIGVVGQFVVLGNLGLTATTTPQRPSSLQWCGINQPTSWPPPTSATAIAQQAGSQDLATIFGEVMAIHGGDQNAVILQKSAVTRMTYVGGSVVFQFDVIEKSLGSYFKNFSIMVGGITYFLSALGFCRTDGVSVQRIGAGKVDRFFWDNVDTSKKALFSCAYDQVNELIYFAYPSLAAGSFTADRLLIYNPKANRWTQANQVVDELVTSGNYVRDPPMGILAFSTAGANSAVGSFEGSAGTAILETGDIELNPGGRSFVGGVKPHVESTGTPPAVTVRVGASNDLGSSPSYTATTTPTTRTGFADCRVDAKYHRAETQIVGSFTKADGLEFKAAPSSGA